MLKLVHMLHELHRLEGETFVVELYRQVLGREAEAAAIHHYVRMLQSGTTKISVIINIIRSREARQLYALPYSSSFSSGAMRICDRIRLLMNIGDHDFVEHLYLEMLNRAAEEQGVQHYLLLLQTGMPRYMIISGVMESEEFKHLLHHQNIVPKPLSVEPFLPDSHTRNPTALSLAPSLNRKITIIVLTWNALSYTKRCLQSLSYLAQHPDVNILVFDNGSTDGTVEYLRSLTWVTAHIHGSNIGFPAGNNMAITMCDPNSDILLLNNDTVIEQQDWLERMQETAYSEERIGVVGCRLRGEDGKLQHAGTYIFAETCWGQQLGGQELDIGQYDQVRDVQGVVFACAYLKRSMLNEVGLLNTAFFAYFEDTEYCLRAIAHGYRVVCDGRVTLLHKQNTTVKANKVNFEQLFNRSKEQFRVQWSSYLDSQYTSSLNWHSIANVSSGYANSSRNLMHALDDARIKIHYRYVYGPGTPYPPMEPESGNDYRINVFGMRRAAPEAAEVVYGQGDVFFKNTGAYKIGYTMLEVNGLPQEWVRQCNQMNEVWVPSSFNAETFRNSGVRVPIHVIPLGVDRHFFHPRIRSTRFSDKFTFLTVFEWGERKAPMEMLQTFLDEFREDDVLLVCKIMNYDPAVHVHQELSQLKLQQARCQIKILYNQELPNYQLGSLYRAADCFVLATRGEGWGMPILEAMASGLPTIATNWSAQTDFLNEHTGYPIRVKRLIPAVAKCPYYHGFSWAEPDYEHMASLMRYVYNHANAAKQRSERVAEYIGSQWSWQQSASKIIERLNNRG